jgi:uncharacterized membrane protein (UPF0127 family)
LPVELGETVEELSIQESALNTENAATNSVASTRIKAFPGFGHRRSMRKQYVMVSIFMKSQSRSKRANRTEGTVRLLLIILWAAVVVVLGFYSGLAYRHH